VPAGNSKLVLAWEAAYSGTGEIVNGNQIIFARLRIRIDVAVPGTYTITHPYGQITFNNVTLADGINYTEDIGGIHPVLIEQAFQGIMAARAAPALVWPDYLTNPALVDPATGARFVGDNTTPHIVSGSPTGNNLFRIEGPGGIVSETNLFVVMGKLDMGMAPAPWTYPPPPPQLLAAVGPVNRVAPFNPGSIATVTGIQIPGYPVGFPVWYQDTNTGGLQLTICPGTDPQCISMPVNPLDPESVALNVGDEAFFWSAEATAVGGGINGLLVLGFEAAFGGDGTPEDGNQITFTRLRIRIDAPVAGDYTITHPFGTKTFTNVPAGRRTINFTDDIGGASPLDPDGAMAGALYGNISKFLTWPDFINDPTLVALFNATGNRYIGSPLIPHTIVGSPTGNNLFRIEGPGGRVAETNLFSVSGKVFDIVGTTASAPVINSVTATPALILDNQTSQLAVVATDTDGLPSPLSYNWIIPAGAGSVSNAAIANPIFIPAPAATTQTVTLTVQVSDGLNLVSGTVDVTVTPFVPPPPPAPIALDDAGATNLNTKIEIQVLANDVPTAGALDRTTVAVAALPLNGKVAINPATGSITYTPNLNFIGSDSFTYTVRNTLGAISNIATVTVTVNGPATLAAITVTRAQFTARTGRWIIQGRTTVPSSTLTFRVGPDFAGPVVGVRVASRLRGTFSLSITNRNAPADATKTISIQSSDGTLLLGVPVTVR